MRRKQREENREKQKGVRWSRREERETEAMWAVDAQMSVRELGEGSARALRTIQRLRTLQRDTAETLQRHWRDGADARCRRSRCLDARALGASMARVGWEWRCTHREPLAARLLDLFQTRLRGLPEDFANLRLLLLLERRVKEAGKVLVPAEGRGEVAGWVARPYRRVQPERHGRRQHGHHQATAFDCLRGLEVECPLEDKMLNPGEIDLPSKKKTKL